MIPTERPLSRLIGLALALFVLCFVGGVEAITIVSQTGSIGPNLGAVNGGIGLEASWTQLGSYSNVGVTATIKSGSATAPGTDTFFLTTSLGPGTTVANQVASNTLAVPSSTATPIQIFSGLTLGPGTYFLVLGDVFSPAIFWATSDVPTVITNTGVTFNGTGDASPNCGICPYYPAATYDTSSTDHFLFEVTGTPTRVPAPAALLMLGSGLAGLCCIAWRRHQAT
jgi:hypothetical protein